MYPVRSLGVNCLGYKCISFLGDAKRFHKSLNQTTQKGWQVPPPTNPKTHVLFIIRILLAMTYQNGD